MSVTLHKTALVDQRTAQCPDCGVPLRWDTAQQWWACPTDPEGHGCGPLAPCDVLIEWDEAWRHGPRGTLVVGTVQDESEREDFASHRWVAEDADAACLSCGAIESLVEAHEARNPSVSCGTPGFDGREG